MESANYDLQLRKGWKFHTGEIKRLEKIGIGLSHETCQAGGAVRELDLSGQQTKWSEVDLPHDWLTEQPFDRTADPAGGYKKRGTGWYYLSFQLPDSRIERARLVFEGVLGKSTVYVNGVTAARNFSGYNRFSCEIGDYLLPGGENTIALHVDARRWEGWWYEGAGLYRPVYIEFRGNVSFDGEKCFLRTVKSGTGFSVVPQLRINGAESENGVTVAACLKDAAGKVIARCDAAAKPVTQMDLPVEKPELWSPEAPCLYTLFCELRKDGKRIDSFCKPVGLRTVRWEKEKGMLLNDEPCRIKGICCHQDHGGVGAALTKEIMEYRLSRLKELGVNAYRCAHHPPSESFLELCDRMGMLVMVENRHFSVSEDVLEQLDSMVYVSRNHPSVFLYSLFNEEPWQKEERGRRIASKMRQRIMSLDDTRAITGAQNGGVLEKRNASDALDVIGINYFLGDYEAAHRRTPDKVILGTENCPTYATRGVYITDREKQIYANYGDEWGSFSESLEETMEAVLRKSYVAGCFAWCGFDHRGEPTPYGWPSVKSHWGFCDDCGFPKDTAYLLASWYREALSVHLLPHWNWKKGEQVRVCAYTNGQSVELFLNEKSLGEKTVCRNRVEWEVPFEKGTLRAVARRGGAEVYDEVHTPKKEAALLVEDVTPQRPDIAARIVNISAVDEAGVTVPDFCGLARFTLRGGRILGIGNGDPNDHHREKASFIKLFHGRAQIIVSADTEQLTVRCGKLPAAVTRFSEKNKGAY